MRTDPPCCVVIAQVFWHSKKPPLFRTGARWSDWIISSQVDLDGSTPRCRSCECDKWGRRKIWPRQYPFCMGFTHRRSMTMRVILNWRNPPDKPIPEIPPWPSPASRSPPTQGFLLRARTPRKLFGRRTKGLRLVTLQPNHHPLANEALPKPRSRQGLRSSGGGTRSTPRFQGINVHPLPNWG